MSSESSRCSDAVLAWNERRATNQQDIHREQSVMGSKGQSRAVKGSRGRAKRPAVCRCCASSFPAHGSMGAWQNGRMATSEGYGRTTMTAMMMGVDNP